MVQTWGTVVGYYISLSYLCAVAWCLIVWIGSRHACQHDNVRCIHGDEIVGSRYRRRRCLDCGAILKGPLPVVCHYTGQIHDSYLPLETHHES